MDTPGKTLPFRIPLEMRAVIICSLFSQYQFILVLETKYMAYCFFLENVNKIDILHNIWTCTYKEMM